MRTKVTKWEMVDLGIEHSQYFQGFGRCGTGFESAVYGIGEDPREALDDCLEHIASAYDVDVEQLEREILAEYPALADVDECFRASVGFNAELSDDEESDDCAEVYYHIGIRWS